MDNNISLFSSPLQIPFMYLKFIVASPSQYSLMYIVILQTKICYHFLEVISIEKKEEFL